MIPRTKKALVQKVLPSSHTIHILPPERVADSAQVIPLCYKIPDAARLLSVSRRTVERLIVKGELVAVGTGKLKRVLYDSIVSYIKRHLHIN